MWLLVISVSAHHIPFVGRDDCHALASSSGYSCDVVHLLQAAYRSFGREGLRWRRKLCAWETCCDDEGGNSVFYAAKFWMRGYDECHWTMQLGWTVVTELEDSQIIDIVLMFTFQVYRRKAQRSWGLKMKARKDAPTKATPRQYTALTQIGHIITTLRLHWSFPRNFSSNISKQKTKWS